MRRRPVTTANRADRSDFARRARAQDEAVEFVESKAASQGGGNTSQPAQNAPQTTDDGWMNIPEGVDEELPF